MKTAGICLLFLHMDTAGGQMFLLRGHTKTVFVDEKQNNITENVQNIQFWIDNPPDSNYTVPYIAIIQEIDQNGD